MSENKFTLTGKQSEAWKHLTSLADVDLMFGGAKGGAKTFLLCLWAFYWAKQLITMFELEEVQDHPMPVGFMGRKRSVDFSKTTLETWKRIIPPSAYTIKEQEKEIVVERRVKICYGGLDDQENINKFNSAEFAFIAIDQAEETDRSDIAVLEGSLRLTYKGRVPPYKTLYTANPADCWLKEDFVYGKRKGAVYIPAKYTDNPYLPANYGATLEKAFSFDEALLKAYRDGDWEALQTDLVLIPSRILEALADNMIVEPFTRSLAAIDPSQGGDEFVILIFKNTEIVDTIIYHERDTMKSTGLADVSMRRHGINSCVIDSIGVGAGIADRLSELGYNVYRIKSSSKSYDDRFLNLRANMWFAAAEKIRQKKSEYPRDEEMRRQLTSVRYIVKDSTGKIQIEPKADVRKRIGRSCDRADAFVMGLWGLDHCNLGDMFAYKSLPRTAQLSGEM